MSAVSEGFKVHWHQKKTLVSNPFLSSYCDFLNHSNFTILQDIICVVHPWCSKPTHRYPIRPTYSITVLHPSEMVLFGVKVIFGVVALHKKSSFSSCKAIFVFLASGLLSTSRVDQNFSAFESRLPVCELSQNVQLYFLKSEKEISGRYFLREYLILPLN